MNGVLLAWMVNTVSWSERTLELNGIWRSRSHWDTVVLKKYNTYRSIYTSDKCIKCSSDRYTTFSTFIVQILYFHLEVVSNGNVDLLAQPCSDLARWLLREWPAWTLYPASLLTAVRAISHLAVSLGGGARLVRMLKTVMCSEGMNRWHCRKLCFSK
jgi:hypothetical protein